MCSIDGCERVCGFRRVAARSATFAKLDDSVIVRRRANVDLVPRLDEHPERAFAHLALNEWKRAQHVRELIVRQLI